MFLIMLTVFCSRFGLQRSSSTWRSRSANRPWKSTRSSSRGWIAFVGFSVLLRYKKHDITCSCSVSLLNWRCGHSVLFIPTTLLHGGYLRDLQHACGATIWWILIKCGDVVGTHSCVTVTFDFGPKINRITLQLVDGCMRTHICPCPDPPLLRCRSAFNE